MRTRLHWRNAIDTIVCNRYVYWPLTNTIPRNIGCNNDVVINMPTFRTGSESNSLKKIKVETDVYSLSRDISIRSSIPETLLVQMNE